MSLQQLFSDFIKRENLFSQKDRLLLAVSGGLDSVVLCELCHQSGYDFEIAHCNFRLRGAESDRDEAFVRSLGEKYGVVTHVKTFNTAAVAKEQKKGIEEAARDLRYAWFKELTTDDRRPTTDDRPLTTDQQPVTRNQQPTTNNPQPSSKFPIPNSQFPAKPINHSTNQPTPTLTAHHADDNIETVVMNFFRGTGIKGLRGMLPKQGNIVRPLLFARRSELEAFAKAYKLDFVTDSTNAQSDYTRNYFRNELIPAIEKVFPGVQQNILQNIRRYSDIEIIYNDSINSVKEKLTEKKGNEIHIPVLKLAKAKPLQTVLFEIIKEYGFTAAQTGEAEKLLSSSSGKYILSPTHRMLRNRNWLIIAALENETAAHILIEEDTTAVKFAGGEISIEHLTEAKISSDANAALIDGSKIKYPLLLRKWKQGDYFYPLGMQKKKKLSRFFIDQKLSLAQKEKVWVIESDKKIIWVAGLRIDDRVKLLPPSTNILKLTLLPA